MAVTRSSKKAAAGAEAKGGAKAAAWPRPDKAATPKTEKKKARARKGVPAKSRPARPEFGEPLGGAERQELNMWHAARLYTALAGFHRRLTRKQLGGFVEHEVVRGVREATLRGVKLLAELKGRGYWEAKAGVGGKDEGRTYWEVWRDGEGVVSTVYPKDGMWRDGKGVVKAIGPEDGVRGGGGDVLLGSGWMRRGKGGL
ncbi:hypothetical protein LTR08_000729 [Meristemomyces frigidus]|nr:hypothetical protein LTR08_000729 [Meristemomyces frigidus]